ncbi:MAG: glycosyltransferase family 2 protein [Thiovulaceae bacterium]|nr:glycosyltransferase family 2 protein [Sulfurimonadaceae bacterium]
MQIAGVLVLYHPDNNILLNIKSYIDSVDKLYVIDNSENKNNELTHQVKALSNKCIYIDNNGNQGIAQALNLGARLAIEDGASWLLTMDQDSQFNENNLDTMIEEIKDCSLEDNIVLLSPMHLQKEIDNYKMYYDYITMTSGNLIKLKVLQQLGGFEEKLFIDCVDTDYCLRIKQYGFKIKRFKNILLEHELGQKQTNRYFTFAQHNYIRSYYMMRNRLYLWNKYSDVYSDYIRYEKLITIKAIIKIILLESDKLKKLKMIYRGYRDYERNIFGKYNEQLKERI